MPDHSRLLNYLATSPTTPPALLGHLVQYACQLRTTGRSRWTALQLRTDLASNPNVTPTQLGQLVDLPADERPQVLRGLFRRTDLTDADVLDLLGADRSATTLDTVLDAFRTTDGTVSRYAYDNVRSIQIWTRLVQHAHHPQDLRLVAAADLACHRKPLGKKPVQYLVRLSRERVTLARTRAEHTDARAWVTALATATTDKVLIQALEPVLRVPFRAAVPGDQRWLANPRTPVADVHQWAAADGRVPAWAAAIGAACDTDATLALAAQRAHPASARIAARVLTSGAPVPAKQAAVDVLTARRSHPELVARHLVDLLATADADWAVDVLTAHRTAITTWHLKSAMGRTDLRAHHLDALTDVQAHLAATSDSLDVLTRQGLFGVWLATYPTATPLQRRHGARMTDVPVTGNGHWDRAHALGRTIAALAADLEHQDPATVGGRLPLALLDNVYLPTLPGVAWLLAAAVAAHLPATFGPDAARTMTTLATDFSGSLEELFTTSAVIGS